MTDAHAIEARLVRLERQVRGQRLALAAAALVAAGALLAAFAPPSRPPADLIEARAIRILDAAGRPRILIGAPPPVQGRLRTDAQTASIVVLGPDGADRLVLGEEPNPRIAGTTYPRIAPAYGLVLHDQSGSERGGVGYFDNGRGVISLDRAGGDAVALIANDRTGFAGLTVNYDNPVGSYAEGVRIGTRGDEAWLSLQDRAQGERAHLSTAGTAAPRLVTRPAGTPPANP
jgi:hypothetical protein